MKKAMKLAVLMGMSLLAAGMAAQTAAATKVDKPPATAPSSEASSDSDYVIGADDMLRISVWKEPDLSESLPVRPDGKISMPLLNDVPAAGLTPLQLKDSITGRGGAHWTHGVAAAHDDVAGAVAGRLHAIRQCEGDLPLADGKR
jgi:protein involved in polysaccharide export with SLBB domain